MENKFKGGSVVLLLVVLVSTLVVAVIGATYAYFRAQVTQVNVSSMVINTADLKITYTETQNINVSNITPGWSSTKIFTIANNGSGAVSYTIAWTGVTNNLVNKTYLKYKLELTSGTGGCTKAQTQYPSANATICSGSIVAGAATQGYKLTMQYLNDTSFDQSSDMGKSVAGTISVTTSQVSQ